MAKRKPEPSAILAGTVCDQIRATVAARGLSIHQLAEETGIDRASLRAFLKGRASIVSRNIDKLCKCLGLELVETGRARDRIAARKKPGAGSGPETGLTTPDG